MTKLKIKPIHYGLYGEGDFLQANFINCERIGIRSRKYGKIEKHIHTSLFQVFIIESGTMQLFLETTEEQITAPAIITIPENILHGMKEGSHLSGNVLTVSSFFLESFFFNSPEMISRFNQLNIIPASEIKNSFETICLFAENLQKEMTESLGEKEVVMETYLKLMLNIISRSIPKKTEKNVVADSRNTRYFKLFRQSVCQSYSPMKTITQYAAELSISGVHLNRICQSTVGKPALQVVHEFLVLEAEKFLLHSDLQVAEIACKLNFEDPAYFSRLFRKYTGKSPKEFRKKIEV